MAITLDGTTGITTPGLTNTGTETLVNLTTTGNTTLGDASTDTLNVGNGGLIKDASGNVGIGVTPGAWASGWSAMQFGARGSVGYVSGAFDVAINVVSTSTTENYLANSYASRYRQQSGQHIWFNAPIGTAGNAITFTQAMTLDASGNLLVGATSNGNGYKIYAKNNNTSTTSLVLENNNGGYQLYTSNGELAFYQLNVGERARIDSSGNLLVGTTSSSGSASNTAIAISGAFQTASGSVSAPSSTPTAVATLPNVNYGTWIVNIALSTGVAATWSSNYILNTQGTSSNIGTLLAGSGSGLGISMSGLSLRVQQGSGATQTVYWSITRIF